MTRVRVANRARLNLGLSFKFNGTQQAVSSDVNSRENFEVAAMMKELIPEQRWPLIILTGLPAVVQPRVFFDGKA